MQCEVKFELIIEHSRSQLFGPLSLMISLKTYHLKDFYLVTMLVS